MLHNFGRTSHADSGLSGTYPLYVDAYQKAASELGVLPRELQSVVWEHVRERFPESFKTEKMNDPASKKALAAIQQKVKSGDLTKPQAKAQSAAYSKNKVAISDIRERYADGKITAAKARQLINQHTDAWHQER